MHSAEYTLDIFDRGYARWMFRDAATGAPATHNVTAAVCPARAKLFAGDTVCVSSSASSLSSFRVTLLRSPVRALPHIPAVLVLHPHQTFGRAGKRLLYKCVPNDPRLPAFLVPYDVPVGRLSKVYANLYVTLAFAAWEETQPHPRGTLTEVLGSVDDLAAFGAYQLHCRQLHVGGAQPCQRQFRRTLQSILLGSPEVGPAQAKGAMHTAASNLARHIARTYALPDRTRTDRVLTLDPAATTVFDDGLSVRPHESGVAGQWRISVYIANVALVLDALDLWSVFPGRAASVYLPHTCYRMLPAELTGACSLVAGELRVALTLDLVLDVSTPHEHTGHREKDAVFGVKDAVFGVKDAVFGVKDAVFGAALVCVARNGRHDDPTLLDDPTYAAAMCAVSAATAGSAATTAAGTPALSSRDLVRHLMQLTNRHAARALLPLGGIFCTHEPPEARQEQDRAGAVDPAVANERRRLAGKYTLEASGYAHVTSPIRRLADLLNSIPLQQQLHVGSSASAFYAEWAAKLDTVNAAMTAVRRVQHECELLRQVALLDPAQDHEGFVLQQQSEQQQQSESCSRTYTVYLPRFRVTARVRTVEPLAVLEKRRFKLIVFAHESSFKKKVRAQLVSESTDRGGCVDV